MIFALAAVIVAVQIALVIGQFRTADDHPVLSRNLMIANVVLLPVLFAVLNATPKVC